jgi:hypothetical protein
MIEVIVLILLVMIAISIVFSYSSFRERMLFSEASMSAISAREKIKIAEKKYMGGKLKKSVFDALLDELEEELISAELIIFRLKRSSAFPSENKSEEIMAQVANPTKYKKSVVQKILRQADLLRQEMSLLEAKLLKREIKESVFEKLIKDRERELIRKEKELMDIISKGSTGSPKKPRID